MEIVLASERVFRLLPRVSEEQARLRTEEKKVALVAGMLGNLFTRPKPEEFELTGVQHRWEPFWHLTIHLRTVYDRQRTFALVTAGPEVKQVTLLGQTLPAEGQGKSAPTVTVTGTEHCEEEHRTVRTLSGAGVAIPEPAGFSGLEREEVADLARIEGAYAVVAPEMSSGAVVRQVLADVIKPVKAHVIREERVTLEQIDLCFRPVYGFEYHWAAKGKRAVLECDGLTGEVRAGGPSLSQHLRSMISRDMLFDISADALGMVVPGGSIAVKLTKAAIDAKKS